MGGYRRMLNGKSKENETEVVGMEWKDTEGC